MPLNNKIFLTLINNILSIGEGIESSKIDAISTKDLSINLDNNLNNPDIDYLKKLIKLIEDFLKLNLKDKNIQHNFDELKEEAGKIKIENIDKILKTYFNKINNIIVSLTNLMIKYSNNSIILLYYYLIFKEINGKKLLNEDVPIMPSTESISNFLYKNIPKKKKWLMNFLEKIYPNLHINNLQFNMNTTNSQNFSHIQLQLLISAKTSDKITVLYTDNEAREKDSVYHNFRYNKNLFYTLLKILIAKYVIMCCL